MTFHFRNNLDRELNRIKKEEKSLAKLCERFKNHISEKREDITVTISRRKAFFLLFLITHTQHASLGCRRARLAGAAKLPNPRHGRVTLFMFFTPSSHPHLPRARKILHGAGIGEREEEVGGIILAGHTTLKSLHSRAEKRCQNPHNLIDSATFQEWR
jgi:hypothetical protein